LVHLIAQFNVLSIYNKTIPMKEIQEHNKERLQAVLAFLKWYRINSGYSQQMLSECSDIHRNTIVRYESCIPKNLTLLTVFEIADAMELDVNQIFQEIK
jgi:DNA-binding XRE family transcriptional regulator